MVKDNTTSTARDAAIKKRRKTTPISNTSENIEVDIYKRVVDFEEKEALQRPADVDAVLYFKTCDSIRDLLASIYILKKSNAVEKRVEILEKGHQACVLITILKKLNRLEKIRAASGRDALAIEKQRVDSSHLQYQNLCYEADHLANEFQKCLQFKSKDAEIELVSIEDFYNEAPDSIVKDLRKTPESVEQQHQLHLARLEWELAQRKQLAELCKTLELEKEKLCSGIIERKNRLDGLGPRLAAVLEATKPLQEHLGLPIDKVRAEHKLASLLPDPLYLFYAQVDAFQQVYESDLTVVIKGDKDEAEQLMELQQQQQQQQQQIESDDSEPEQIDEVVETKKRRHHKGTVNDRLEEKRVQLLRAHPLSVHVTIGSNVKDGTSLMLELTYRPQLKIITVTTSMASASNYTGPSAREVLTGESVIADLFTGDSGLESPNPSNGYQLQRLGLSSYQSLVPQLGHAYDWAQKICGLDFLALKISKKKQNGPDVSRSVEMVMKALKKRLHYRILLAAQLQKLDDGVLPSVPDSIQLPRNSACALTKWTTISWQQFCSNPSTVNLIENECVCSNDMLYQATFTRGKAVMNALVAIKNNYPVVAPILSLTLKYDGEHNANGSDEIRDMERAVNVGWDEVVNSVNWLLSAQLRNVCAYVDVYLESLSPTEFPQNTVFFKSVSARNRRRPFKFRKIGTGLFSQY